MSRLEEYRSLRELVDTLPHGAAGLADLGTMFESVGLGDDAVCALLRMGEPKGAIDACVRLNHWERFELRVSLIVFFGCFMCVWAVPCPFATVQWNSAHFRLFVCTLFLKNQR